MKNVTNIFLHIANLNCRIVFSLGRRLICPISFQIRENSAASRAYSIFSYFFINTIPTFVFLVLICPGPFLDICIFPGLLFIYKLLSVFQGLTFAWSMTTCLCLITASSAYKLSVTHPYFILVPSKRFMTNELTCDSFSKDYTCLWGPSGSFIYYFWPIPSMSIINSPVHWVLV